MDGGRLHICCDERGRYWRRATVRAGDRGAIDAFSLGGLTGNGWILRWNLKHLVASREAVVIPVGRMIDVRFALQQHYASEIIGWTRRRFRSVGTGYSFLVSCKIGWEVRPLLING